MTKRSTLGGGALLALALIFIGLIILFDHVMRGWRVDLTENRLYTTAPGTANILRNLQEPVNLYFFFSEKTANQLPQLKTYGTRVQEFLEELAARSNGKLRLNVIDPQPFSEDEDRAAELGVRGAPVGPAGQQLYFGLAGTNSTDGKETIEFFDPQKEEFLEYDVVKLIHQLGNPKKPTVGWLSSLPMQPDMDPRTGQMTEGSVIFSQLQQLFTVKPVNPGATQLEQYDVLVVIHPKDLAPGTQFAIDQYALNGGHVIAFVDPIAEADQAGADPQNPMASMMMDKSSTLGPLFTAWGIEYDPRQVIADNEKGLSVSMRQGEAPTRHLGILGLSDDSFAKDDVVTAGLSNVNVATIGYFKPKKDSGLTFEPLLLSSAQAAPLPSQKFTMLMDPSTLRDGFKATGERYALAARVTGKAKSAFPNGPPDGVQLAPNQTALKEAAKPINVIVFADTDMLQDFLWVRQQNFFGQRVAQAWANNGDLTLNAIDNLAGSTDLISVRGRATFTRPFDRVEALRRNADDRFRATEQELEKQLTSLEEKLTALESQRNDKSSLILSPEQESELESFQEEKLRIRKELRDVRLGLDQDIRGLGNKLKFINIVLVPVIFAGLALLFVFTRRKRLRTANSAAVSQKEVPA